MQSTQNVIDELKLTLHQPPVISRRELLFAFIKEWKEEFKDENWDYLDFVAERVLSKQ